MGSEKTWEEKFEDYLKDNSMKRMYMVDYLKAGYDIAKEEEKAKIEKLKKALEFYADKCWLYSDATGTCYLECHPDDIEAIKPFDGHDFFNQTNKGGKLARQILKEIE